MSYLILAVLVLILAATVAVLVLLYLKLKRSHFLLLMALLVLIPVGTFKIKQRAHHLSFVPDALQVDSISYREEDAWGFGPGGNEAGIIVYALPAEVAAEIERRGMAFFEQLPANENQQERRWRGRYEAWFETPVSETRYWKRRADRGLEIRDYICHYGFCIEIDDRVVEQTEAIINTPGSYYAYGRIGLIVVSPARKVVVYLYNG